jgi:hypothetical protein
MTQLLAIGPVELMLAVPLILVAALVLGRLGKKKSAVTGYDATIMEQHAAQLYRRAASIVLFYSLVLGFGAMGGAIAILGATSVVGEAAREGSGVFVLLITAVGILVGWSIGNTRAFSLRLQAQQMLCQVQTEKNTRLTAQFADQIEKNTRLAARYLTRDEDAPSVASHDRQVAG